MQSKRAEKRRTLDRKQARSLKRQQERDAHEAAMKPLREAFFQREREQGRG